MAKSRMYRKKGRKSMRKGRRKTQRVKRRGGTISEDLYKNFTDSAQLGAR
jgi:hypothetical protein